MMPQSRLQSQCESGCNAPYSRLCSAERTTSKSALGDLLSPRYLIVMWRPVQTDPRDIDFFLSKGCKGRMHRSIVNHVRFNGSYF